jgi:hypothetical protein
VPADRTKLGSTRIDEIRPDTVRFLLKQESDIQQPLSHIERDK